MPENRTVYTVELLCDYPQWWRYNIYMMLVGYDRNGEKTSFENIKDRVYDVSYEKELTRTVPEGYDPSRPLKITSGQCQWAELYVYVIANTFPESPVIRESPSFVLTMQVSDGNKIIEEQNYEVNQWGGLTIVAHPIGDFPERK